MAGVAATTAACSSQPAVGPSRATVIQELALPRNLNVRTSPNVTDDGSNICATIGDNQTSLKAQTAAEVYETAAGTKDPNGPWYQLSTDAFVGRSAAMIIDKCGADQTVYVSQYGLTSAN